VGGYHLGNTITLEVIRILLKEFIKNRLIRYKNGLAYEYSQATGFLESCDECRVLLNR
jgi:hypothetical protein